MRLWAGVVTALLATPSLALDDTAVRQQIINESVAAYLATGHPCACPYNVARNGSQCGKRSAWSKPGGQAPLCYPDDVTADMIANWRAQH